MRPKRLERVLHFIVVFTLPMIKFGHIQIHVPKIGITMLKTAYINPTVLATLPAIDNPPNYMIKKTHQPPFINTLSL